MQLFFYSIPVTLSSLLNLKTSRLRSLFVGRLMPRRNIVWRSRSGLLQQAILAANLDANEFAVQLFRGMIGSLAPKL
jgi:hypothetical protein